MGFVSKPIFSRLAVRFGIRQDSAEQLENGHQIVPITNADELVKQVKFSSLTGSAASRNDDFTVGAGKKWVVSFASGSRSNAGSINIQVSTDGGSTFFDLNLNASATFLSYASNPVILTQGWIIRIAHGTAASGPLTSCVFYTEEDMS